VRETGVEIEAKFDLTEDETGQTLSGARELGPFQLGPAVTLHLADAYLDTSERDCLRQGYECRLRTSEEGILLTLKAIEQAQGEGSQGVFRREEIEQALPAVILDPLDWPDGEARSLIERLRESRPLAPIVILYQQRIQRPVLNSAREIGKLALDHVTVQLGGRQHHDYRMVEIELAGDGSDEDLQGVVAALTALPGLRPASESKFERALALLKQLDEERPSRRAPTLARNQSMPVAGAIVLSRYWNDADKKESAVRKGDDPEAVHDMRVAIRRVRAAYALLAPWYPERAIQGFRPELRRLGRRLGAVRDQEVLLAEARAAAEKLPQADLRGLIAHWEEQYATDRVRLIDYLDSADYDRFARRFERFLASHNGDEASGRARQSDGSARDQDSEVRAERVCDVVPSEVWSRYGHLHAYAPFVSDASIQRLHRLRIAGKRLRYVVESFEDLLGEEQKAVVGQLKALQDALGDLHDADVSIDLLESFRAAQAGPNDRIEPYLDRQRAALLAARARFEEIWPRVAGEAFRADLTAALAGLWGDAP
jgi:CHAD domain-containing protein